MPLTTGLIIKDRYRTDSLLAQGGMGAVYKAWDLNLKMAVALKENLDPSPDAQAQFEREALILARISHPNLPRVIDHFSLPGHGQFLVMDFVDGKDLEEILEESCGPNQLASPGSAGQPTQNRACLSEAEVIPWTLQVCDALEYLHKQNPPIVHRDIKPANIKIRPDGQVLLVDFGIAKIYDPQFSTLTGAKAVTAGYSPPEQYGGGKTDPRSDIYALGATLYHLLTGEKPPESVHRMAGSVKTPSPRQLNPLISPNIQAALLKAMAIPIENRYQNVGEMRLALDQNVQPRPAPPAARPIPVPSIPPSRQVVAPSPAPGNLPYPRYWPVFVLGGLGIIVLLLIAGRLILSDRSGNLGQANQAISSATQTSPSTSPDIEGQAMLQAPSTTTTQSTIPTTQPTPTAPLGTPTLPIWPVAILDSFDYNRSHWSAEPDGELQCNITQGKFICITPLNSAAHYWLTLENIALEDSFFLALDTRVVEGQPNSQSGLIFRDNPNGRYLFSLRADGYFRISSVQKRITNWVYLVNWTPSTAIHPDMVNHLVVSGSGTHYAFFINNELVAEIDDDQWKDGNPGVHIFSVTSETPAVFEFDNYELRQP
jgi:serine/threonine protein kinase